MRTLLAAVRNDVEKDMNGVTAESDSSAYKVKEKLIGKSQQASELLDKVAANIQAAQGETGSKSQAE
jgi:hypothetical protein